MFVLISLCVIVLSWFLPWLYSIVFPTGGSDPFVAYSPVSNRFIVSKNSADGKTRIYALTPDGQPFGDYTKEERDSLLPQVYFNQLMAHEKLPDSINGTEVSVQILKHNQWYFSSLPRDINKVQPDVCLIMESMPERFDLEDAKEVFTLDGKVEFTDMATNSVNEARSRRFNDVFADRGFEYPLKSRSANITTRKPYDEGYLMVDAGGDIYHMKMQAGRPYMTKVKKTDSIKAAHVFIMENPETRHLGLVTDEANRMYVLERDGYRLVELPVGAVDPTIDRISIVKDLFNWVVKLSNDRGARWYAIDSDNYSLRASYAISYPESDRRRAASYLFPFQLTFTEISDCFAFPRILYVSPRALYLNIVLAVVLAVIIRRRKTALTPAIVCVGLTCVLGLFSFIPMTIIRD